MLQSETVRKYDTYKDSGIEWIGKIPSDKNLLRNKYFLKYIKGKNPEQLNSECKGVPYVGASELDNLTGTPEYENYTEQLELPQCTNSNVLVLWDGARAGLIGKNHCGAISSTIIKLEPNLDKINENYLFYYLKGFEKFLYDRVNGTTIPHMNRDYIEEIKWIDFTIDEQQKIAKYLDKKCGEIDRVIETEKLVIEKLKEYKQSIITEAVTKGLNKSVPLKDSGIEWIGQIPQNWKVLKFSNIAKVKSNLVNPNEYLSYYQISPENIEKDTGNLLNNFCTVEESGVISGNHLFFKGQILYSKIRPNLNKVTIAPFDGLCSADMYPIETDVNTNYFLYTMLSDTFVSQVKLYIENRVKMPKINQNELSNIYVAIPNDSKEQELIAEYLDKKCSEIDKAIANKEQVIEKFTEYKKSLIYECVTGKKRVA